MLNVIISDLGFLSGLLHPARAEEPGKTFLEQALRAGTEQVVFLLQALRTLHYVG